MKTGDGFLCRLLCLIWVSGCALAHTTLLAQSVSFTAGPTAVIIEPTIPPVRVPSTGNNLSLISSPPIAADLAGIGRADIVVGVGYNAQPPYDFPTKLPLRVLRPSAGGVLSDVTRQLFGSGALPSSYGVTIHAADFNRDGKLDLFGHVLGYDGQGLGGVYYPSEWGGTNILLEQTANGTFVDRSATLPPIPDTTHSATLGDVNGDGILDIYVGNIWIPSAVGPYFLMGKADGTFSQVMTALPAQIVNLVEKFTASLLVDVDNDGFPDLVLGTHHDNGYVDNIVLFNDGTGDFTKRPRYTLPRGPFGANFQALNIKSIDANSDGYPDLLIVGFQTGTNNVGTSIQLLINQKDGTFIDETVARLGARATPLTGPTWDAVQVVDINGDGKPDILASSSAYGRTDGNTLDFIWLNDGSGHFTPIGVSTLSPQLIGELVATDVDGDGAVDLVAVQFTGDGYLKYQTFLNTTPRTVPSEPIIGTAVAGNAQLSVSFSQPLFTGASAITGYAATCSPGSFADAVTATGSASPITVTGLSNFAAYTCTVTATNASGTSLPSAGSRLATPQGSLVVAVTGNGTSALGSSVTFTATLSGGSSPSGTVRFKSFGTTIASCVNQTLAANVATCTTTALAYGAQSIKATYSGDANNPATASPAVAHAITAGLLGLVNPVLIPTVAAGSTRPIYPMIRNDGTASLNVIGVSFTGPFTLNQNMCGLALAPGASCTIAVNYSPTATSGPITGSMQVTHSGSNSPFVVSFSGTGTTQVLSGAFNPASVIVGSANSTFTLTLNNPNGIPLTNVDISFNLPGNMLTAAIPNPTSTCSTGTWGPPSYLGGGPLAGRTASEFSGGTIPANSTCTISINVSYSGGIGTQTVQSFPFNSNEVYATFAPVTLVVTPPPTVPDPPANVTAAPGDGLATFTFSPPANNGGLPITGYQISCSGGPANVPFRRSPATLTGLGNGIFYGCQVTTTNSIGTSLPSALVNVTPAANAPLFLVAVQSRKNHVSAGIFDLEIDTSKPANGAVSVEPRISASGHTIVFQFNVLVAAAGSVSATDSISGPVSNVNATKSGREVIVTLPGIPDNRRVTISLAGVVGPLDSAGATTSIGFLVGDVNGSHAVNAGDISAVKAHLGQSTNLTNFWLDLNGSGGINPVDVSAVKARSGLALP